MAPPIAQSPDFGYIGFQVQAAIGTGVAPTKFAQLAGKPTFKPTIKSTVVGDGTQRDMTIALKHYQYGTLSFTTYLTPDTATYLLGLALSGADVISGSSDPYLHTVTSAAQTLYPATYETGFGMSSLVAFNDVWRLIDGYVDDAKLTWDGEKAPTLAMKVSGISVLPEAAVTSVAFDADRDMVNADCAFTFTGMTVNGVVPRGSLDIKNNNKVLGIATSNSPIVVPGKREIDFEVDVAPTDKDVLRQVYFGTTSGTTQIKTLFEMTSFLAQWDIAGSPDHYLSVLANNIVMTDGEPTISTDGEVFLAKGLKGKCLVGGSNVVTVASANAVAAAYWS